MFLFNEMSRIAADHIAAGRSVRIVGAAGSGRSSTLRETVQLLESRGTRVFQGSARDSGPHAPGQLLEHLELIGKALDKSARGLIAATRNTLATTAGIALAIDDFDEADPLSAQVLSSFGGRVTMLKTLSLQALVKPAWPEVSLVMPSLSYDEVRRLMHHTLGSAATTSLVAQVLNTSGGNPELVVAIIESARLSGLLDQRSGTWHLAAPSLWNEHLRPFVLWRLRDLDSEELKVLERLSASGPRALDERFLTESEHDLRRLLSSGMLRTTKTALGPPIVYVWPPLVADMLSANAGSPMVSGVAGVLSDPSAHWRDDLAQTASDSVAAGRIFQRDVAEQSPRLLAEWEQERTPALATRYLLKASGSRFERPAIQHVLRDTRVTGMPVEDVFRFEFQRAQWLACDENDLAGGLDVLRAFAADFPSARTSAEAGSLLLRAFLDRIPADFADRLEAADPAADRSGVAPTARALLEAFSGNVEVARRYANGSPAPLFRMLGPAILRPLLSVLSGDTTGAHTTATRARDKATLDRDRLMYIGSSYISAMALMTAGRVDELEQVIGSALSTAQATMLLRPFFGATLNISAISAALTSGASPRSASLLQDAEYYTSRPGPLFGMGTDVPTAIAKVALDPFRFDDEIAIAIGRRRELGYLSAAASTAVLAGCISIGPEMARETEALQTRVAIPLYSRALSAIVALARRDVPAVEALANETANGDTTLLAQIVGAAHRRSQRENDQSHADALQPLAQRLGAAAEGSFDALRIPYSTEARHKRLSAREREIARLAGHLRNPEIATYLGISVRTVENHITAGLRKTGMTTRFELSEIAENSP